MTGPRGGTITTDRECEHCGYNLRGQRYGSRCPECGTPALNRRRAAPLAFHEMPLPMIRRFRTSCRITAAAMAGVLVLRLAPPFVAAVPQQLIPLLLAACTLLWTVGTWLLTEPIDAPQASAHGLGPRSRVRRATRWLQLGWVANLGGAYLASSTGDLVAFLGWMTGMAGVFTLSVHLARLADWVGDEFARKAFYLTLGGTATAVPIIFMMWASRFVMGGLTVIIAPLVMVLALCLLVASLVAFPVGLFALARSVEWCAVHARDRVDRSREMAERIASRASVPVASPSPPRPPGPAPTLDDAPIPLEGER